RDGLDLFPVRGDVQQNRRRGGVPVPNIVVDKLIMPDALTGFGIQANNTVGEEIVPVTMAAEVVSGRHFYGDIDIAQLFIGGQWRPGGGVPGVLPGIVLPGVVAELAGMGDRTKRPEALSGSHVKATDIAG